MRTIDPKEIADYSERHLQPLLAGLPPAFQGAVLADLLAIWLAGHFVPGDIDATRTMRAELLATHLQGVRDLVNVNAKRLGTPHDD